MLRTRITRPFPDTPAGRVGRRWERMWATALLVTLTCLAPIAHASPPDPVWIAGTYDGADSDDVLLKATLLEASVESGRLTISPVADSDPVLLGITSTVPASTLPGVQARAPPRARNH